MDHTFSTARTREYVRYMKQNASAERTPSINFKTSQELEQIFDAITDRSEKMNLMSFALLANACKHICKNISSRTPPSLCSVAEQLIRETLMLIQENLFKVTYNKDSTKLDEKLPDLSNRLNDFLEKLDHANRIKPTLNVDRRLAKELSAGSRLSEKFRSPPNRSHSSMEEDEIFPGSSAKMASRVSSSSSTQNHKPTSHFLVFRVGNRRYAIPSKFAAVIGRIDSSAWLRAEVDTVKGRFKLQDLKETFHLGGEAGGVYLALDIPYVGRLAWAVDGVETTTLQDTTPEGIEIRPLSRIGRPSQDWIVGILKEDGKALNRDTLPIYLLNTRRVLKRQLHLN